MAVDFLTSNLACPPGIRERRNWEHKVKVVCEFLILFDVLRVLNNLYPHLNLDHRYILNLW